MTSTTDPVRDGLAACLAVPRWVERVAAGAPYSSVEALLAEAEAAADPLAPEEVEAALADHPRIGERHAGSGRSASFSAAEQSSSASADERLSERLAEGNRAYEERFGRVFLIRAAGRSRLEILAELDRRLEADPDAERAEAGVQLREIALLRLAALAAADRDGALVAEPDAQSDPEEVRP